MGTSSIYNGPKDKNPLLPEGFEDDYNTDNQDESMDEDLAIDVEFPWKATKSATSQFAKGKSENKGRITKNYVRALGGASNAAKSAKAGIRATIQLGNFLSDIVTEGINATFNKLNIEYKDKSVEALFSEIVNVVARDSNSKDDIAAKNASMEALSQLYDYVEENDMDIQVLEKMNEVIINKVMKTFINSFLIERLLKDLQSRFEKYADNLSVAVAKENEVKEYITESVEVKLNEIRFDNLAYNNKNIDTVIESIYRDCYEILEDYL
ncbi:Qat anti-phage system associated protein QatB [Priestia aryabhattai]|uniref:Qat anti-phage system associated protein QatB n=1 Tax=Priestia aryabhattai TaxID=412384 RepID=UPI00203F9B10|nr:Qat anti-phage system associated protein QatB [Priestia aryabhattai]MCM3252546.1 hypothetical protein [Priestia aryabhattai]